jgi:osmotically-inducible protein OsmY
MKNDIQIQRDVITELEQDDQVPTGSVGVEVHHGVVKLAGASSDTATKESAVRAARRVDGVTKIVVDMDVGRR